MKTIEINSLVLAYLGDSIYEEYTRLFFIKKGLASVKELQKEVVFYVKAPTQAYFLKKLLDQNFFNENELTIIYRARNAKGHKAPKGSSIIAYKKATALEAVIGYLYLEKEYERVSEIMKIILEDKDVSLR